MSAILKKTVYVIIFVLLSSFAYSQDKSYICKSVTYNFGVWDEYKDEYIWYGEEESAILMLFSDNSISVYTNTTQVFLKDHIFDERDYAVAYKAIDQDGDLCDIGIIDNNKHDQYLTFFVRYKNYAYYYNFYIVK